MPQYYVYRSLVFDIVKNIHEINSDEIKGILRDNKPFMFQTIHQVSASERATDTTRHM